MTEEQAIFVQEGIVKRGFVTDVRIDCRAGDYVVCYRHKLDGKWYSQQSITSNVLRQFQNQRKAVDNPPILD